MHLIYSDMKREKGCNVLERAVLISLGRWRDEGKEESEQGGTLVVNGSLCVSLSPCSFCLLPILQQIDGDWRDCAWSEWG